MKKTRIIDLEENMIPVKAFKYVLFKELAEFYEECEFFDFLIRKSDILGFSLKRKVKDPNGTDVFSTRLDKLKKKLPKLVILNILIMTIFSIILYFFKQLLLFSFKFKCSEKSYLQNLLYSYEKGIEFGDCLFSAAVRSSLSDGYQKININFCKFYLSFMLNFYFGYFILQKIEKKVASKKLFFCFETTYSSEAYRRLLLNHGYREIRYDKLKHQFREFEPMKGYEIRKQKEQILAIYKNITELQLEQGYQKLRKLVYREETYPHMTAKDVNPNNNLDLNGVDIEIENDVAIIFMHAVSDAQYVYGADCFLDLHDWLIQSIKLLRKANIQVVIKLHPSFYSPEHDYPADKKYLKILERLFGIDFLSMPNNKPISTNWEKVFFLHYSVAITELSKSFPNFLCITHHGRIACEAAYLGHWVICSDSSPYNEEDSFVCRYKSINDYSKLIKQKITSSEQNLKAKEIYRYIYVNYFIVHIFMVKDCFRPIFIVNSDKRKDLLKLQEVMVKNSQIDNSSVITIDNTISKNWGSSTFHVETSNS